MKIQARLWTTIGIVLLVSGCAYTDSVFGGRVPPARDGGAPAAPSAANASASPAAAPALPDLPPDTAVAGADVTELRASLQRLDDNLSAHQKELQQIDDKLVQDQAAYTARVAVIKAGLRPGGTSDQARLVDSWSEAETALDRMADDVAALTALARGTAGDGQLAAQLGTQAQALRTDRPAGADAGRTVAQLGNAIEVARGRSDTLTETLKSEVSQRSDFVSAQRGSLGEALLAIRELSGTGSPAAAAAPAIIPAPASAVPPPRVGTAAGNAASMAARPPSGFGERRPFVVIRFDRPDVAYEDALGVAVKRALARQPDVSFDVNAVAANDGTAAGLAANTEASKQHLAAVVRALVADGVPIERIVLSASSAAGLASDEIRIYVH